MSDFDHDAHLALIPKDDPREAQRNMPWAKPSTCRHVYRPVPRSQHWLVRLLRALWEAM